MRGALAPGIVPALLRDIYVGRRTGMLRFIRGEERRCLRFMGGHIVYGEASLPELHMGEVLVARGRLGREALDRASAVVNAERKRLGSVLVEMGALDQDGLEQALALHVEAILVSVFSLRDGVYTFQDQDPEAFLEDDWPLAVPTGQAVLAAVAAVTRREDVIFALGDVDRLLLSADDPLLLYQRIDLAPGDSFVLSRIDGTLTAREVIAISPGPPEAAERSLFALLCTGIVEFVSERPRAGGQDSTAALRDEIVALYEALPSRTDREVLGVSDAATEAEMKSAYLQLAKRYHPDVHHAPEMASIRHKVEAVFFRLHDAYRALARAPAAPAHVARASEAAGEGIPENMLRKADERMKDGRHWEAIALLEEAIGLCSGRLRVRARVLLARALLKYPDREKQAEKELLAAVQEDGAHADAHYLLGRLYKGRGYGARASAMLRRALEINPGHRAARADLEDLEGAPRKIEDRLRRLFGRD